MAIESINGESVVPNAVSQVLLKKLAHASEMHLYTGHVPLNDINNQDVNSIVYINRNITSSDCANLPTYGVFMTSLVLNWGADEQGNHNGKAQIVFGENQNRTQQYMWFRCQHGSGTSNTWSSWEQVYPANNIENGSVSKASLSQSFLNGLVRSSEIHLYAGHVSITDINDQQPNTIVLVNRGITSSDCANLPMYGIFMTSLVLSWGADDQGNYNGKAQVVFGESNDRTKNYMWFRCQHGSGTSNTWSPWVQVYPAVDIDTNTLEVTSRKLLVPSHTCNILRKVVCCGDSYTSGHVTLPSGTVQTNEEFAWPHYMESITGNTYVNCGSSGATVLTWQTAERGLAKAVAAGVSQAYIIGLMLNDVSRVSLGTADDIGTQAQTYYGGMSQIVEALHDISPNAYIFIQTCPNSDTVYQQYNQAVRDIVTYYYSTCKTMLLDLAAYGELYNIPSITSDYMGYHYTAQGYEQFAEILAFVISDYINTHVSDFQNIHLIPFDAGI